jgi:polyisoprenoid-binding protein YceI
MKNLLRIFLLFSLLLPFSIVVNAAPIDYTLDPDHTYVLWHINHFQFSNPSGKWMAAGNLVLDKENPKNSQVKATINLNNLVTGVAELDKHLKEKLFFDVTQFPTASFVSNSVNITSKTTAKVHGTLTLHGISKPVTLNVIFNKAAVNPITNKDSVGFSATTTLKRSDFDITTLLPGISDEVKINIEAEAYKTT